jgi:hypothetical protein
MNTNQNFAPGRKDTDCLSGGTQELSQPGRSSFLVEEPESKIPACNGVESEEMPNDVTNHIGKLEVRETPTGSPGCSIRPVGVSQSTDLCLWEDLEIGEAFYLPFMQGVYFKTGIESFGIAPTEPEWEWRVAGEGREPVWLVARAEVMQCRRCDCTELNPCFSFTDGACAWARPGLCTVCLTDPEVRRFLQEGTEAA